MPLPRRIYELHAPAWLSRQRERFGRPLSLAGVPDAAWEELAALGFDHVWTMGVWRRSPAGRRQALAADAMRRWHRTLPDLADPDVLGSPYAVHDYSLDPLLGDAGDLAHLRERLDRLGLGLILDFVPNHLAIDHPWTESQPARFVRGAGAAVDRHPEWFFRGPHGERFAHGRDPHFAPWSDTVQVDWSSAEAREALASELIRIGEVADGVRVDMAMLGLADVVAHTWGEVLAPLPATAAEPWADILTRVRAARPGLVLIAEAYWGREPELLSLGFDAAYDKTVYDLLLAERTDDLRAYLGRAPSWLGRGVHFTENHDEERAQVAFGRERARAATVVALTLPGLALVHDRQIEGARRRAPIHLGRAAHADVTAGEEAFYRRLLAVTGAGAYRDGTWRMVDVGSPLLSWAWTSDHEPRVVVVNASPHAASASIDLTAVVAPGVRRAIALDELTGDTVGLVRTDGRREPIHLHIDRWGSVLLRVQPASE